MKEHLIIELHKKKGYWKRILGFRLIRYQSIYRTREYNSKIFPLRYEN